MNQGKRTCKILKDIRREIAKANDIEFVTSECRYKGDCLGTCPKCEAEVQYLEEQLRNRQLSGKKVALAGLLAGAFIAPVSSQAQNTATPVEPVDTSVVQPLQGMPAMPQPDCVIPPLNPTEKTSRMLMGKVAINPTKKTGETLMGEATETMPAYTRGDSALLKDIQDMMVMPKAALKSGVDGRVVMQFVITKTGNIKNVKVVRAVFSKGSKAAIRACKKEAIRIVKSLSKKWTPGTMNGEIANMIYTLPIKFKTEK